MFSFLQVRIPPFFLGVWSRKPGTCEASLDSLNSRTCTFQLLAFGQKLGSTVWEEVEDPNRGILLCQVRNNPWNRILPYIYHFLDRWTYFRLPFVCFCIFLTKIMQSEESSRCFDVVASAALGHWIWPRHAVCCSCLGYVFVEVHSSRWRWHSQEN